MILRTSFRRQEVGFQQMHEFVGDVFRGELHAKRVLSLSNAAVGLAQKGSLALRFIGEGLAQAKKLQQKHCVKQVDRLFSNKAIKIWDLSATWVPHVVGERKEVWIAMDWTDFDADDQTTLMLSTVTEHGRTLPLLWQTYKKSELKDWRSVHEGAVLGRLREVLPAGVYAIIMADRGFGDTALYRYLQELKMGYVIRFRGNIEVTSREGKTRKAGDWVGKSGRAVSFPDALVTGKEERVPKVVCVREKGMQDTWCLACSEKSWTPKQVIRAYGKRFTIEETFRDIKDYRFGMGMREIHTKSCDRRDAMFLVSALAIAFLTLLGAAGEQADLERTIKPNTVKTRTYSLFTQGSIYYGLLPGMKRRWASALIANFIELLRTQPFTRNVLGII